MFRSDCASSPPPPIICWNSDTTSTHEKKCGRYTMPWMTLRSLADNTLFSSNASAIGIGKKNTNWTAVIVSVLTAACQNAGSENIRLKLAKPMNSLSRIPTYGE